MTTNLEHMDIMANAQVSIRMRMFDTMIYEHDIIITQICESLNGRSESSEHYSMDDIYALQEWNYFTMAQLHKMTHSTPLEQLQTMGNGIYNSGSAIADLDIADVVALRLCASIEYRGYIEAIYDRIIIPHLDITKSVQKKYIT